MMKHTHTSTVAALDAPISIETSDYVAFKAAVHRKTGLDLNLYKSAQMHRRLQTLVERAQQKSFMDYYRLLERDASEYTFFLDRLTINVSELFRNPEKWVELRTQLLPSLRKNRPAGKPLKIWSAGCSYGAEPYTLAIMLDQELAVGERSILHATDFDRNILAKAQEGLFTATDARNIDAATRQRYFVTRDVPAGPFAAGQPLYQIREDIRARVTFRAQNLLADRFEGDYDLICCRNVVIYFTDEAKEALYTRFYTALKPGGILFVGGTERIFNASALGFSCPVPFFYQRCA